MAKVKGGDKLAARLAEIARNLSKASVVEVGFLEDALYPDGTPVALIAAVNEFGKPPAQPPRPFFRNMIAAESPNWGAELDVHLKNNDYNSETALNLMGFLIKGQLQQSINDLLSPPLAPVTIARKGFDKPLIETSHMLNSVGFVVK